MSHPFALPVEPMLARAVSSLPEQMAYEPKFDGFRCLAARDNDRVELWSRGGKDLARYFPELVESLLANLPPRIVLDGEIVLIHQGRFDFSVLSERIHPAASRVELLSRTHPASFVAWDVLAIDGHSVMERPFEERRSLVEDALAHADAPVYLAPQTRSSETARDWLTRFEGAGVDGVMAKPLDEPYAPGQRTMFKLKHHRDADLVVGAWREHKTSTPAHPLLGSLILGCYDGDRFEWVGACGAFSTRKRAELAEEFAALTLAPGSPEELAHPWVDPDSGARRPGGKSRWKAETTDYRFVAPTRVAEIAYDHLEDRRLRHLGQFVRWRPDRDPRSCTFAQFEDPAPAALAEVLGQVPGQSAC